MYVFVFVFSLFVSFEPKPLPVQGVAKFCLRCKISYIFGVTSAEERNLIEINAAVVK